MNTPEWLKPGVYGALIGAVFVGVVGFTWGGSVTGGTANDRAMAMSRGDVVSAVVPNQAIAQACLASLDVDRSPSLPENAVDDG